MTPQVHIVLATYNGERYIREQIDSILANTVKDISIEICDDGSADQTVKIAREYAEKHACIHVHENEKNLGYVKNFIAEGAAARILCFATRTIYGIRIRSPARWRR